MSEPTAVATNALSIAFTGFASVISSYISSTYDVERAHRGGWKSIVQQRISWEGVDTIAKADTGLTAREEYMLQRCQVKLHTLGLGHLRTVVESEIQGLAVSSQCSGVIAEHCRPYSRPGSIFWLMQSWITVSPAQDVNSSY